MYRNAEEERSPSFCFDSWSDETCLQEIIVCFLFH